MSNPISSNLDHPRPPQRPLRGPMLILPLLLAAGLLWARSQEPSEPNFDAQNLATTPRATVSPQATPDVAASPTAASPSDDDDLEAANCCTTFVPTDDGKLQSVTSLGMLRIVPRPNESAEARRTRVREAAASQAISQLLTDARMRPYLPTTVKLLGVRVIGEAFAADFNQAFATADVWGRDRDANLVLTAVVNTILRSGQAAASGESPDKVRLFIEGQPAQTLGELDVSGNIEPDDELVAKS